MRSVLLEVAVGLFSGFLSGQFGVGGGIITTPAIRLLLGRPELIAVGTPLPVIIPGAIAGAVAYARKGLADLRSGLLIGGVGAVGAVIGAFGTRITGGKTVMLATAVLIACVAVDLLVHVVRRSGPEDTPLDSVPRPPRGYQLALLGMSAGVYSGFLGLGGGFVIVPALVRFFGYPMKRAFGTSLIAVALLAVPGTIVHAALGHVEARLAFALAVGVVPGALLGAKVTHAAEERSARIAFALLLVVVAVLLGVRELWGLG